MKTKLIHLPKVIIWMCFRSTLWYRRITIVLMSLLFNTLVGCIDNLDSEEFSPLPESAVGKPNNANRGLPHAELAQLRGAVAPFHNFDKGFEAGYNFEATGYRTMMGFHYLNGLLVDDQFDLENPEVLLYAPSPSGGLRLVAVEYVVPIADLNNPQPAPEGFEGDADVWVINTEFSMWTLHVWIGLHNPNGIFASHNPRIP